MDDILRGWFAGALMLGILGVNSAILIRPQAKEKTVIRTFIVSFLLFGAMIFGSPVSEMNWGLPLVLLGGVLLLIHSYVYLSAIRYHGGTRFPSLVTHLCLGATVVCGGVVWIFLLQDGETGFTSLLRNFSMYRQEPVAGEVNLRILPFLEDSVTLTAPVFVGAIAFLGAPLGALLRTTLESCRLEQAEALDQEETVGAIERWLTFFFVINSWFAPILIVFFGRGFLLYRDQKAGQANRTAILLLVSFGLALVVGVVYSWLPWTDPIHFNPPGPEPMY